MNKEIREELAMLVLSGSPVPLEVSDNINDILIWACRYNHIRLAKLLISKGADVNARDINGYTPIHKSALNGHTEIVRLLIANNVNVNVNGRRSPLRWAIEEGHTEIANILREASSVDIY